MAKSSEKTPNKKGTTVKKTSTCTASQLLGVIAQIAANNGGRTPRELVAKRAGYGSADNGSFKRH